MPTTSGGQTRANALRVAFLVVAGVGAVLSADLIRLHVRVYTDPDFSSFCAVSERVNCESVALSDYSVVLGLPLAVWGLIAYLSMAGFAFWGLRDRRTETWPFGVLFWITALTAVQSIVLFAISHYAIRSVCIVCIGTYAVNFALWGLSWAVLRRHGKGPVGALVSEWRSVKAAPGDLIWYGTGVAIVVVALMLTMPTYWEPEATAVETHDMPVGHTEAGHPWIGAEKAELVIVEYSDFQCPHCSKAHFALRKLLAESKAPIQLVHRHFPLDDACNPGVKERFHPRACEYSLLAHCADQQGHFWAANDYLFANGRRRSPIQPKELARAVGLDEDELTSCAGSDDALAAVSADIVAGSRAGVGGTPAFVVRGRTYLGHVPAEVLRSALPPPPDATPGRPSGRAPD